MYHSGSGSACHITAHHTRLRPVPPPLTSCLPRSPPHSSHSSLLSSRRLNPFTGLLPPSDFLHILQTAKMSDEGTSQASGDDLSGLSGFFFYVFIVHPATAWILKPGRFERKKSIMYAIGFLALLAAAKTGKFFCDSSLFYRCLLSVCWALDQAGDEFHVLFND